MSMLHNHLEMRLHRAALATLLILALVAYVRPASAAETAKPATAAKPAKAIKDAPYPLTTCVVSGEDLGAKPIIYYYNGREVRFCCGDCSEPFKKEPEKYLKKIDDAVIKQQKPAYPLQTCVVSGQKLGGGDMTPYDYVYKNRLVRFCCKGCVKTFQKDPAKYLAKIDAAKGKAKAPAPAPQKDKAQPASGQMDHHDMGNMGGETMK